MKKKIILFLVAALCVALLAACTAQNNTSSTNSQSSSDSEMDGGVLYLTGTVSDITDKSFTLTTKSGTTKVAITADSDMSAVADGLIDGEAVAVGCLYVDTDNVNAISVVREEVMDGGVLYLTGTVSDITDKSFTLTTESVTTKVAITADSDMSAVADGLIDGEAVAVGCLYVDADNVNAISVVREEVMDGGILYLTGTVSSAANTGFDLIMEGGSTVYVIVDDSTDISGLADGIVEDAYIAVGAKYIDGKSVNAPSLSDE